MRGWAIRIDGTDAMFYRPRRRPSMMHVTLLAGGARIAAPLLDVSSTGMKVAVKAGLPEGSTLKVEGGRLTMDATVCWSRAGHVGLILDRQLSEAEQAELSGGY